MLARWSLLVLALTVMALPLGCGGDSAPDAPALDTGAASEDAGSMDASLDAGGAMDAPVANDAGGDAGGASGDAATPDAGTTDLAPYIVRLAYFPGDEDPAPAAARLCGRETSDTDWTELIGGAGIARGEVSRWAPARRGVWTLELTAVGAACGAGFYTTTADIGLDSATTNVTLTYSNGRTPGIVGSVTYHRWRPSDLAGLDRLVMHNLARAAPNPPHVLDFVTASERTRITGSRLDVPSGTLGAVEVNFDELADVSYPYLAGEAVSTSLFVTGTGGVVSILFCDDFAPPDGLLAHCASALRTP